jgi:hypothetical protein
MPVVVNQKLLAKTFSIDKKTAGSVRAQSDNGANKSIARNLYREESSSLIGQEACRQGNCAARWLHLR